MATRELSSSDVPLWESHDSLWLDLDGVVYRSADPVDHAVESLCAAHEAGVSVAFLTNNASRAAREVGDHLRSLGLGFVADRDVATSAEAIASVMADQLPVAARVLVIGGAGLRQAVAAAGLIVQEEFDDSLNAVVQGYSPDLGWRDLARAAYAIQSGAVWFASNDDLTMPTSSGTAPGNGSLVQAVRNAVDVEPIIAGKPHAPLFDLAQARTGAMAPLMIGDRIDTDIVGAVHAGVPSLWVATGVDSIETVCGLESADRPDFVGQDLRVLAQAHPPVKVQAGEARCGAAIAVVRSGAIEVSGGDHLAALRAVVGLAWDQLDAFGDRLSVSATLGS